MILLLIGLFIIGLVFIGFAWYIINYLLVKLPEQQRVMLETFTIPAVKSTKQQYLFNDEQQHAAAMEKMYDIFKEFNVHPPGYDAVDTKIRSAIYGMWKEEDTLEKLRADIEKMKIDIEQMIPHTQTSPSMPVIEVTKVRDTEGIGRI